MTFPISPKTLPYSDYLPPFELIYRDVHNLNIINEFLRLEIRIVFSSLFLTLEKFAASKSFSKNTSLIIPKLDKGNSVAIIGKNGYPKKC